MGAAVVRDVNSELEDVNDIVVVVFWSCSSLMSLTMAAASVNLGSKACIFFCSVG